ncbi:Fc.00g081350.m01.CDS01 [Cosmosporella sp. VM-42]
MLSAPSRLALQRLPTTYVGLPSQNSQSHVALEGAAVIIDDSQTKVVVPRAETKISNSHVVVDCTEPDALQFNHEPAVDKANPIKPIIFSHRLMDITVISPVFDEDGPCIVFYTTFPRHHLDIGGFDGTLMPQLYPGCSGSKRLGINFSDPKAQQANRAVLDAATAITYSALIYVCRQLVSSSIPLNQDYLAQTEVIPPKSTFMIPSSDAAICCGNTLTLQCPVDLLLKAFQSAAGSQGCMNCFGVFGGQSKDGGFDCEYGETVCGGESACPGWHILRSLRKGIRSQCVTSLYAEAVVDVALCMTFNIASYGMFDGEPGELWRLGVASDGIPVSNGIDLPSETGNITDGVDNRTYETQAKGQYARLLVALMHHSLLEMAKTRLRLMPLGGSVTYGVGASDGNGYRKALREMLLSDGFQVDMVGSRTAGSMNNNDNEGWRGFRIDQVANKAKRSAARFLPNLYTLNAGSNDCIQNFEIQYAHKRIGDMLESLWTASPQSTIILSTLVMNSNKEVDSRVLYVNDQIRVLAKQMVIEQKRLVIVDMRGPEGPQLVDLTDGTHPNDLGYRKMAEIWFKGIQEAMLRGLLVEPQIEE